MSRSIGDTLPHNVLERLNGHNLDAVSDRVLVVCSVDDRGFPHPALLSYFETIAIDARTIRLAMYSNSRSVQNARREGRLTLVLVEDGVAYYIKGHVRAQSIDAGRAAQRHIAFRGRRGDGGRTRPRVRARRLHHERHYLREPA